MKKTILLGMLLLLVGGNMFAQQITGKVTSKEDGSPIGFATVLVKGHTTATSTADDGSYAINVPEGATTLVFSFFGMTTQEVLIGGRNVVNAELESDAIMLEESVVTALGLKREKKALSYSVQEVTAEKIVENRTQNVASALAGKVAGLNISKTSTPGGSNRIVIRGASSLSGNNSPLIIVDGIPYDNKQGVSGDVSWGGTDYGDGLSNINQDDIETISVLKGPSATALYGSRAGNGVILITTKKGTADKGARVSFTSNFMVDRLMIQPEYQNEYGQGTLGEFQNNLRSSWGPKMEGQILRVNNATWAGIIAGTDDTPLQDWTGQSRPFSYTDNDMYRLLQTGHTWNNSVEVNIGTGTTAIRASVSDTRTKGVIPNNKFSRTNATLRATGDIVKNLTFDTKFTYTYQVGENRPTLAVNGYNPMFGYQYVPRSIDLGDFFPVADPVTGMARFFEAGTPTLVLNPYIATEMKGNQDITNRVSGFAQLRAQFTDWLSLMGRIGVDTYQYNVEEWYAKGSRIAIAASQNGRYTNTESYFLETNNDFLLVANKDNLFGSKLSGSISAGGSIMDRRTRSLTADAQNLNIDGLYTIANGLTKSTSNSKVKKQTQSLYAFMQASWDGWLFLDATVRNDWSSTLPKQNWSFLYPSVGLGWVVTDMLSKQGVNVPSWITFGKLRGSVASVGNDTDPYRLYPVYSLLQNFPGGVGAAVYPGSKPNALLKPEKITSYEIGADLRLFNNRVGIDFTYYKKIAKNQIFSVTQSMTSGYSSAVINAGRIDNKGIELVLNVTPLQSKDLRWDLTFNYAKNKSKVVELNDGAESAMMFQPGATAVDVKAIVGRPLGELYTTTRLTNDQGKLLIDDSNPGTNASYGTPLVSSTRDTYIGNMNPDWTGGISSSLNFKGFFVNFLIDIRVGGYIYLNSMLRLNGNGATEETLLGRDTWYPFFGQYAKQTGENPYASNATIPNKYLALYNAATAAQAGVYVEGVKNSDKTTAMAGYVNPQYYFPRYGQDHYFYEMTNVRLRELSFGYNLPAKWFEKTPISSLKASVVMNNLFFIYNNLPGFDPESTYTTGVAQGIETSSFPSTRSIGFNVNVTF